MNALTDLCTGNSNGSPDRLVTTGLLGYIRWWFKVVVHGLGGSACHVSNTGLRGSHRQGRRCVDCELFGCSSWARKFGFDMLGADVQAQQDESKQCDVFRLMFSPLWSLCHMGWLLLSATIRLITDYAAISGKTVYEPSDEIACRNAANQRDYGVVSIEQAARLDTVILERQQAHVGGHGWWRVNNCELNCASDANFCCVGGWHLVRQVADQSTFNRVIGSPEPKGQSSHGESIGP